MTRYDPAHGPASKGREDRHMFDELSGTTPGGMPTGNPDLDLDEDTDWGAPPTWTARAGRRGSREKLIAGLRGLKHAIRGDSSFFAHAYRGILIALTAAMLGINALNWCLLVLAACMVLVSELGHSAIDTMARALGDPEEPGLKMAREIATAGVLVAAFASGAVTVTVLTLKFGELNGWW
jgi:diacylglycerol kinase